MHLSQLEINSTTAGRPDYHFEQYSSDIDIGISNLRFDLVVNKEDGTLQLPIAVENLNNELLDAKDDRRRITASYGDGSRGQIEINGKKGLIWLRENPK